MEGGTWSWVDLGVQAVGTCEREPVQFSADKFA